MDGGGGGGETGCKANWSLACFSAESSAPHMVREGEEWEGF